MDSSVGTHDESHHYTNMTFLEHVVVKMTLTLAFSDSPIYTYDEYYSSIYAYGDYEQVDILSHTSARRGDISVSLKSPQGTVSELLPNREHDFINTDGYTDWEFMSVHYWGENPLGVWELLVSYKSNVGVVNVSDVSVKLYGTETIPHSVKYQCTDMCNYQCSFRNNIEICDTCKDKRDSDTLNCLAECPENYEEISGYCINPNSSLHEDNSNLLLLMKPTDTDMVTPTPSSTHSRHTTVSSSADSGTKFSNLFSSPSTSANPDVNQPLNGKIADEDYKVSAGSIPQLLHGFLLLPLMLSVCVVLL